MIIQNWASLAKTSLHMCHKCGMQAPPGLTKIIFSDDCTENVNLVSWAGLLHMLSPLFAKSNGEVGNIGY